MWSRASSRGKGICTQVKHCKHHPHALEISRRTSYHKLVNLTCVRAYKWEADESKGADARSSMTTAALALALTVQAAVELACPSHALARPKLTPDERVTIDVYKKATPSVVNIANMTTRRDAFTTSLTESPQGQGSGFIFDKEGHVVTNFHVIAEAADIKVTLSDGNEYKASLVGVDNQKDIAVLQVEEQASKENKDLLKPLKICDYSTPLQVGQKVFAIGNPFGLDQTLTVGVVSGTGREITGVSGRPIQDVIQTDAAINPGNSGGPLLDTSGCVIGINTAIYSTSGANAGVGFAIPGGVVQSSVKQIISFGKVVRPALGIAFAPDQSSEQLGVQGIMVLNAKEGGPAFKAGLQGTSRDEFGRLVLGDIITGINGKKIKNSSDLYRVLDRCKVGDSLDMEVLRASAREHIQVVLGASDA
ncbi:hypothetical protein CEUSTIGMA_g605.t1 [Chlamydomonas eustigma]|uniref:PDZ domain-containing protein n=1 Tax=Chlamydomonas eustigma TaxID=1157962 RepID=A0A250WR52_9CHLO|nr:hypothetical protein CEUSTIGMA_g605.t1 [Chlamydomonas eustigma]|eukprot:GAX73152.1 hypothetical protein CEUSTIGMA_g605.t1 [Chlamydomonas eustigma]